MKTEDVDEGKNQAISDEIMIGVEISLASTAPVIICLFGFWSNVVSAVIFGKSWVKDSVRVGLIALSLTDLLVCTFRLTWCVSFITGRIFRQKDSYLSAIRFLVIGWTLDTVYLCAGSITALLSVERCACVVMPFRHIFTKSRTMKTIACLYVLHFACLLPILLTQSIDNEETQVMIDNRTTTLSKVTISLAPSRAQIEIGVDIIQGAIIPVPVHVLTIVSGAWMTIALRKSSRVRHAITTDQSFLENKQPSLTRREARLVKVIITLGAILFICNIPRFIAVFVTVAVPEVFYQNFQQNLYYLLWDLSFASTSINSSINIFVYLSINSNYRKEFKMLFRLS